jgi:hypothetical protein
MGIRSRFKSDHDCANGALYQCATRNKYLIPFPDRKYPLLQRGSRFVLPMLVGSFLGSLQQARYDRPRASRVPSHVRPQFILSLQTSHPVFLSVHSRSGLRIQLWLPIRSASPPPLCSDKHHSVARLLSCQFPAKPKPEHHRHRNLCNRCRHRALLPSHTPILDCQIRRQCRQRSHLVALQVRLYKSPPHHCPRERTDMIELLGFSSECIGREHIRT